MKLKMRRWTWLAGAVVAITATGAWHAWARLASSDAGGHWEPVQNRPLAQPIQVDGPLQPGTVVNITAPFEGKVVKKWVDPGDRVAEGAPLLEIDATDMLAEQREAEAALTRAAEALHDLQHWKSSVEVLAAQRQVATSQAAAESVRARTSETQSLFDKGIIARSELDAVRNELNNATAQWHAARDGLDSVLRKASPAQLRIAQLEYDNRAAKARQVTGKLARAVITAPRAGVVIAPPAEPTASGGGTTKELEAGSMVSTKEVLMGVGDTATFAVRAQLDEHDIARVRPGLPVEISLGADQAVMLRGELQRVSAQSRRSEVQGSGSGPPMFDIQVVVSEVGVEQRAKIRLGMTARLRMAPEQGQTALTVPLEAVTTGPAGPEVQRRNGKSPHGERASIKTGKTLAEHVVVLQGLTAQDSVWVPANAAAPARTEGVSGEAGRRPLESGHE